MAAVYNIKGANSLYAHVWLFWRCERYQSPVLNLSLVNKQSTSFGSQLVQLGRPGIRDFTYRPHLTLPHRSTPSCCFGGIVLQRSPVRK